MSPERVPPLPTAAPPGSLCSWGHPLHTLIFHGSTSSGVLSIRTHEQTANKPGWLRQNHDTTKQRRGFRAQAQLVQPCPALPKAKHPGSPRISTSFILLHRGEHSQALEGSGRVSLLLHVKQKKLCPPFLFFFYFFFQMLSIRGHEVLQALNPNLFSLSRAPAHFTFLSPSPFK